MELRSLSVLEGLAERAEILASSIQNLNVSAAEGLHLPEVPMPLTLDSTADWLRAVDESRRKPRLARAKRHLEAAGIDTAPIPAGVLEQPESIAELLKRIEAFPAQIRKAATVALGRALTKGIDDAASVVDQFSAAADTTAELARETADHSWVLDRAAEVVAEKPEQATEIADRAREVLRQCEAAAGYGVKIGAWNALDEALQAVSDFNRAIAERSQRLTIEGLPPDRPDIEGRDITSAMGILQQSRLRLDDEKRRLSQQLKELASELRAIGHDFDDGATTIAELREAVPRAESALQGRRRELREALGADVFKVVEALVKGEMPTASRVDDAKLGQALRKAVDGGYRIHLEVPREDQ